MGRTAYFKNLRKENSSEIPAHWIYQSINPIYKLLSTNQITLNNCMPVELDLLCCNGCRTLDKMLILTKSISNFAHFFTRLELSFLDSHSSFILSNKILIVFLFYHEI